MIRSALVTLAVLLSLAASPTDLPKVGGVRAVASVNGEPISFDAYLRSLGELHAGAHEGGPMVSRKDPSELLDRLIRLRLILQEADAMGLREQPEFTGALASWRKDQLREALLRHAVKDVAPPTEAEIARVYGEEVREYRIRPVKFSSMEDAEAFRAAVTGGAAFEAEGKRLADEGKATVEEDGWIQRRATQVELAASLDGLQPDGVTGAIRIPDGAVVVKLLERREPEDAGMRAKAVQLADTANKNAALAMFVNKLKDEQLTIDEAVYKSLDYDKDPGAVDVYAKDERALVKVKGGSPIRVKDYTAVLKARFFHGTQRAGEKKRLNRAKDNVLEEVMTERALDDAGVRLKLDKNEEFRAAQVEFEEATLFGLVVAKLVDPSVQVTPEALQTYYDAHQAEFTTPEMVRLDVVSFTSAAAAEQALARLNAGADLGWMREHAESQFDRTTLEPEQRFEGRVLMLSDLPEGLQKALEGSSEGAYRLWSEGASRQHVVLVRNRVPSSTAPLDEVRGQVSRRVFQERRNEEIEALTAKLRAAADVKVYADGEKLRALLADETGGKTTVTR
ncbi:MAG TPA: peptidylprolyl isomerase [Candidatus Polarisedimenticolaceae bacterium]|nr:peptidylprolyl isomerase [Candidatus Polarisedimenticolaceae bacterium]